MRREWFIALGGIAIAALLWFQSGTHFAAGDATTFVFTIVPADHEGLACSAAPLHGERCGFDETGASQTTERPLRPFVTTGGEAVLLAGVFEDTTVAQWLSESLRNGKNDRITFACAAKLEGSSNDVRIRFNPRDPWSPPNKLTMASVTTCIIH